MKKYLLILTLCLSLHADLAFKYGVGLFQSAKDSNSETKVFSLAYQDTLLGTDFLIKQYELGMWSDSRQDLGRLSSGFFNMSFGVRVNAPGTYAEGLWGIGVVTHTDAYLGGNFAFNHDLSTGFRSESGATLGINYKHISNAGLYNPNIGRDFLMIKMGIPF